MPQLEVCEHAGDAMRAEGSVGDADVDVRARQVSPAMTTLDHRAAIHAECRARAEGALEHERRCQQGSRRSQHDAGGRGQRRQRP